MVNRLEAVVSGWLDTFVNPAVHLTNSLAPGVKFPDWGSVNQSAVAQAMAKVDGMGPAQVYEKQPNVRAVVDFLARNVAQLGLHAFASDTDDGRTRDRDSLIAEVLDEPSPAQTPYELVRSIISDLALYDEAWLLVQRTNMTDTGWIIRPLPVSTVTITRGSEWTGDLEIKVRLEENDRPVTIKHGNLIHLHGWAPAYGAHGLTPITALKSTLSEQVAAEAYRAASWKNGGQIGSYIKRPRDTPWSQEAENRFVKSMRAYRANGPMAGGMPLLQDGMSIENVRLTAKEEQWVEAAQLSLETVCRVYQLNPAMVGSTGGVTYANLKEFRRALYTETLAPYLRQVEQKLTRELQRIIEGGRDRSSYLEFNLKEKLSGSFEEEGAVLFQATGGPHMTVNEARARQNLPGIGPAGDVVMKPLNMAGGDEAENEMTADDLLKRVNVAKGLIQYGFDAQAALAAAGLNPIEHLGLLPTTLQAPDKVEADAQAAIEAVGEGEGGEPPAVDAPKAGRHRVEIKAAQPAEEGNRTLDLVRGVLEKHAKRQRAAVLSQLGSKSASWWDGKRWDRELAEDLATVALAVTEQLGADVAAQLGYKGAYDPAATVPFLISVAKSRASMINATTYEQLTTALAEAKEPEHVFDQLDGARGDQSAATLHNTLAAFAGVEAAKHVGRKARGRATKTWVVRSGNSRPAHARMDGQTVDVDKKFSNGADYPGDAVLGADGVAGCMCSVEVEVEIPDE